TAVFRVYLALATAGACVVLAANGGFVHGWVGAQLFAGPAVNGVLAAIIVVASLAHGLATISSVLGNRMQVGIATLPAGCAHLVLGLGLGHWVGLIGVPLAALTARALVLVPLLLPSLVARTGVGLTTLASDVFGPWAVRSLPVIGVSAVAGPSVVGLPIWIA